MASGSRSAWPCCALDQAHKEGTLLVNLGGPAPQINAFRAGRATFADLAQRFDMVVFDPRGFGLSSGISCRGTAGIREKPAKCSGSAW
ncbi:hypothetical protein [Nonomuraea sp. NEAU-A123]|uniref:hypothetical protein n=1 Tax=Nonomuraea sp. NEAU-A123 TaxID=2839649 RepID=UPI001BE464AF|nr:hypothetical protein [Nonomuraea sp. NEAU-A123]MBT2233570.1 hypothetical protein [Nonomuraea sp. NEAU-A123]